jgi:hypothetical protein
MLATALRTGHNRRPRGDVRVFVAGVGLLRASHAIGNPDRPSNLDDVLEKSDDSEYEEAVSTFTPDDMDVDASGIPEASQATEHVGDGDEEHETQEERAVEPVSNNGQNSRGISKSKGKTKAAGESLVSRHALRANGLSSRAAQAEARADAATKKQAKKKHKDDRTTVRDPVAEAMAPCGTSGGTSDTRRTACSGGT